MIEGDNSPELVPYFVSFEGKMPADKLAEVALLLGGMSTEMQVSVRMGNPEAEEIPDVPIGTNDFYRTAETYEVSKMVAGRVVSILRRLSESWGERILLPQGGYSSKALKEALSRGDLEAITGMGPKGCELVRLVTEDLEAQVSSTNQKIY